MTSLVIIPTFNEKENIENIIRAVFGLDEVFHVLIVDDGSPDGTAAIVKELQHEFTGKLHVLEREGKQGLGTAYIYGFKWGLKGDYDFIFEMDADFSHNPNDLPRLLHACREDGFGMAVGSRYCKGGQYRKLAIYKMANVLFSICLRSHDIMDRSKRHYCRFCLLPKKSIRKNRFG